MNWPPSKWNCPNCKKDHSKPHFAFRNQVDLTKDPGESGRVLFDREGSGLDCGVYKPDAEQKNLKGTGPSFDRYDNPNGLFCPHCGWLQEIVSVRPSEGKWKSKKFLQDIGACSIDTCIKKGQYTNRHRIVLCKDHYKLVVKA